MALISSLAATTLMTFFCSTRFNNWNEVSCRDNNEEIIVNTLDTNTIRPQIIYKNNNFQSLIPVANIHNLILQNNLNKLDKLKSLEENWNLYGAKPLSIHLINSCKDLVKSLSYQPDIFPTANSSIQLEYENTKGDYLELEFFNNDNILCFIQYKNGKDATFTTNEKNIRQVVDNFYA